MKGYVLPYTYIIQHFGMYGETGEKRMADLPKLETTKFENKAYHQTKAKKIDHDAQTQIVKKAPVRRQPPRQPEEQGTSLLGVMGMAVVACLLLLTLALSGTTVISDTMQSAREVLQSDYPVDEALGKLKFVSNGIMEVFGRGQSALILPVENTSVAEPFNTENGCIVLSAIYGGDVISCGAGTVTQVGQDAEGYFVELEQEDGYVVRYALLDTICVEQDQPLSQGDAIGTVGISGQLKLSFVLNGVPVDPAGLLNLTVNQ